MDLTANQKNAAIIITIIIGCSIIFLALLTNSWFLTSLPTPPDIKVAAGRTPEIIKQDIENYKNLVAIMKDNQGFLNDLLVAKFLKTLFDALLTSVIAYVFAKPVVLAIAARIQGNRQN